MNKITVESVNQALFDIYNTIGNPKMITMMGDGIHASLRTCFGISHHDINIGGNYTGDFLVKFHWIELSAELVNEGIRIIYPSNKNPKFLSFESTREETELTLAKNFEIPNNEETQTKFLQLIATIIYIRDNKLQGYTNLPDFDNDVRELLDTYAIYPKEIEPLAV